MDNVTQQNQSAVNGNDDSDDSDSEDEMDSDYRNRTVDRNMPQRRNSNPRWNNFKLLTCQSPKSNGNNSNNRNNKNGDKTSKCGAELWLKYIDNDNYKCDICDHQLQRTSIVMECSDDDCSDNGFRWCCCLNCFISNCKPQVTTVRFEDQFETEIEELSQKYGKITLFRSWADITSKHEQQFNASDIKEFDKDKEKDEDIPQSSFPEHEANPPSELTNTTKNENGNVEALINTTTEDQDQNQQNLDSSDEEEEDKEIEDKGEIGVLNTDESETSVDSDGNNEDNDISMESASPSKPRHLDIGWWESSKLPYNQCRAEPYKFTFAEGLYKGHLRNDCDVQGIWYSIKAKDVFLLQRNEQEEFKKVMINEVPSHYDWYQYVEPINGLQSQPPISVVYEDGTVTDMGITPNSLIKTGFNKDPTIPLKHCQMIKSRLKLNHDDDYSVYPKAKEFPPTKEELPTWNRDVFDTKAYICKEYPFTIQTGGCYEGGQFWQASIKALDVILIKPVKCQQFRKCIVLWVCNLLQWEKEVQQRTYQPIYVKYHDSNYQYKPGEDPTICPDAEVRVMCDRTERFKYFKRKSVKIRDCFLEPSEAVENNAYQQYTHRPPTHMISNEQSVSVTSPITIKPSTTNAISSVVKEAKKKEEGVKKSSRKVSFDLDQKPYFAELSRCNEPVDQLFAIIDDAVGPMMNSCGLKTIKDIATKSAKNMKDLVRTVAVQNAVSWKQLNEQIKVGLQAFNCKCNDKVNQKENDNTKNDNVKSDSTENDSTDSVENDNIQNEQGPNEKKEKINHGIDVGISDMKTKQCEIKQSPSSNPELSVNSKEIKEESNKEQNKDELTQSQPIKPQSQPQHHFMPSTQNPSPHYGQYLQPHPSQVQPQYYMPPGAKQGALINTQQPPSPYPFSPYTQPQALGAFGNFLWQFFQTQPGANGLNNNNGTTRKRNLNEMNDASTDEQTSSFTPQPPAKRRKVTRGTTVKKRTTYTHCSVDGCGKALDTCEKLTAATRCSNEYCGAQLCGDCMNRMGINKQDEWKCENCRDS